MCGVCGIFNLNGEPVSPVLLRKMTDVIAHRGPDGEGFCVDSFIGFGHRRLAVIDLSPTGHQPMRTAEDDCMITYNGEVYNFKALRQELETLGQRFVSQSDTEVVLQAYRQWGPDCLARLNGHFAFAIWDKTRQSLFLARDRYGAKPLYYALAGSCFLFASEQKAILTHPAITRSIDLEALLEYFTFQNLFTDRTLIRGIKLFPPGSWAMIPLGDQRQAAGSPSSDSDYSLPASAVHRYWNWYFAEPENPLTEDEYLEELDRLFRQAVNRQLVSDVDVGAYLSGGMDSGSITAIAARQLPYMKTFTCGFDLHSASGLELGFDEREKAEYMSYLFKTEHYEMVLKAGDMERILPRFAWHLEEPRVGQSYPNFYAAQLASKFVKVVLSGGGGDELFGGYPWRYYRAADPTDDFDGYIDKYYQYWQRLLSNRRLKELFQPVWPQMKHVSTRDIFRDVFIEHDHVLKRPEDYVNHSLAFEARTFLHGLLIVDDKLSMAHGLETRVPFLDNDLVDFAMNVPVRLKLNRLTDAVRFNENEPGAKGTKYFQKTNDGKLILRKAMERVIPSEITGAVKQGFSAPDAAWFKGDSIEFVKRSLLDRQARIFEYMDRTTVTALVQEHLNGDQNRRLFIWSLLNLEAWLKAYLN
jgi:asparagine synthase (glutamine-hydrolysing)